MNTYSTEQQQVYAKRGIALPDGRYAIPDKAALKLALEQVGKSKKNDDYDKVKRHIIKRAKALEALSLLPADWTAAAESLEYTNANGLFYAQETQPAMEAKWTDNAEGLPEADIVIMRPGEGGNRRNYPAEVLRAAAETDFFGGAPMFIDHGDDPRMPRKRSFNSLFGTIKKGTSYIGSEGELRARSVFIDPALTGKVRAASENAPGVVGLSAVHEFMGQRYRGTDGHYHERVDRFAVPHSVDVVVYPAQGGGIASFLPAHESEEDVDWNQVTEAELSENRPDLVAAIRASAAESGDGAGDEGDEKDEKDEKPDESKNFVTAAEAAKIAQEAADKITTEYATREKAQAETRAKVAALVSKSGLPAKTQTRIAAQFDGQTEFVEKSVQEAIDTAADELKDGGWKGPKVEGLGNSSAPGSDDEGKPAAETAYSAFEQAMAFVPRTGVAQEAQN